MRLRRIALRRLFLAFPLSLIVNSLILDLLQEDRIHRPPITAPGPSHLPFQQPLANPPAPPAEIVDTESINELRAEREKMRKELYEKDLALYNAAKVVTQVKRVIDEASSLLMNLGRGSL